jgi:hypothetical protein
MATSFRKAVNARNIPVRSNLMTTTENGALTYSTSTNPLVDLFFRIGALRGNPDGALQNFISAYATDRNLAVRIALWARDIRKGAGEREIFRKILNWLEVNDFDAYTCVVKRVPELGRWDDLLTAKTSEGYKVATELYGKALFNDSNGLAAKWAPRKGVEAARLRNALGLTPKQYRRVIVSLTKVVESQMCSGNWSEINLEHVPSLATSRYRKAFERHLGVQYQKHVEQVVAGEKKVNTGAVYPYDVLKDMRTSSKVGKTAIIGQWNNLPNFLGDKGFVLPMIDVSGSMLSTVTGDLTCLDVAVSTGLYLADKQTGPFANLAMTFSSRPVLIELKGNIIDKYTTLVNSQWNMSTDLEAAFREILKVAKNNNVPHEEMPKYLVIISDMEFNAAIGYHTNLDAAREMFNTNGYELPTVVFWNIQARSKGNSPVMANERNVVLVSGFSPAIMANVMGGKNVTPYDIMLETITQDRYNW